MKQLYRNHRTLGYEVARATDGAGTELVILQTAPHKQDVAPAHMLMPVADEDRQFHVQAELIQAIEKATFLGLDHDAIRHAFELALASV